MIYISENLKRLRISRGLTQEELAAALGVSGQAVSRWETGTACPDIEILPGIANYFSVSLDELCGMEKLRAPGTLRRFFDEECSKRSAGDLDGAVSTLRAGLKLFPDEPGLLGELALTLTLMAADNPDGKSLCDEAIALSERLLCMNCPRKLSATICANLVYLYKSVGETGKAGSLAATLPHIRECRELIRPIIGGDFRTELAEAVRETIRTLCELISNPERFLPEMLANGLTFEADDGEMLGIISGFLRENPPAIKN